MKRISKGKFVDFRWSTLALLALMAIATISGVLALSASQHEVGARTLQPASAGTGSAIEVNIDNFAFTPAVTTVKAGTQVTWVNHDDIPHTVDSTEGKFKSGALDTNDKFEFRFTQPGEYPFYCRMHPKMTGKIIVQ
jgi:plastocyanin